MNWHMRFIFAILLVATPIVFTWHAELLQQQFAGKLPFVLTNGFFDFSTMQAYHINMYLMFIVTWISALILMLDDELLAKRRAK